MTKELEALKQVKNFLGHNYCSVDLPNELKLIEQALQRLEAIDNANPSEALEFLKQQAIAFERSELAIKVANENYDSIKQALIKAQEQEKVLEIIKKKNVDVDYFLFWCRKELGSLENYNNLTKTKSREKRLLLTQEEFDTLKRYCNEIRN